MRAAFTFAGILLVAFWVRPAVYRIEGSSMSPTLRPGMLALGVRARRIASGQVVVARDPFGTGFIVKRVTHVRHRHMVWLAADNADQGVDSRAWGWLDRREIVARVLFAVKIR